MNLIIEYWYIGICLAAVVAVAGITIYRYFGLPRGAQLAKVREWLLWAVTRAEKELGGGTGKLKLRTVYDAFLTKFPWLAPFVSFKRFSELVDDALEEMRKMLDENEAVKALVNGEDKNNGKDESADLV